MAATAETIEDVELLNERLLKLEHKVFDLQLKVNALTPKPVIDRELLIPRDDPAAEKERVLTLLRAEGVIVEPGPRTKALAAEWEALSEEEKRAHRELMDSLKLDPPLSQIITDNRR